MPSVTALPPSGSSRPRWQARAGSRYGRQQALSGQTQVRRYCKPLACFDAQGVDRVITRVAQAERRSRAAQRFVEGQALVDGDVELESRSADVAHPRGTYARVADVDLGGRRKRERCF